MMETHQHAGFLDKLIDLVPARFYVSDDDEDTEKKWFHGLSKVEKAKAKRVTVENLKKAKRDRLDPEKSVLTTLDLKKRKLDKEKSGKETEIEPMIVGFRENDTYEKVRKRFQQYKRKRNSGMENLNVVEEAVKDLTYGYFKIRGDDDEDYGKNRARKRVSKAKELEMAMKLEALKKDPVKGDIVAKRHSWKTALSRASGIKVHDDPKLLKKRIRKEKKRREKNAEKWKERIEEQQKVKVEKQQKRSENITNRIQEKKMRKIAKREKKRLN